MNAITIMHRVESFLSADLDRILRSSFFSKLKAGSYSQSQLRHFAEQYYVASSAFPQILALAAGNIGDDQRRLGLISNLWDEHGNGTASRAHRAILEKFVVATGSTKVKSSIAKPSVTTYSYVAGMKALCSDKNERIILGALGPGCEAFTPTEYVHLTSALREVYGFSDDQLEFFIDHARHDGSHIKDLYDGIALLVEGDDCAISDVVFGARVAMHLERVLWEGLDHEMRSILE
jgi:pyrroloquinoline quinone (PQQ) biosynthesis protein C